MPHIPVSTLAELDELDIDEIAAGYDAGARGDFEPDINHGRAYHHGWREWQFDAGIMPLDFAAKCLQRERAIAREWARRPSMTFAEYMKRYSK